MVLWDGGNNDFPFYRPDLLIVVADPLRAGDEGRFHPGETNVRMADVVVINKVDSADPADVERLRRSIRELNPRAEILLARSSLTLVGGDVRGKRVIVVEDGPTLTHGGMTFGAGVVAAQRFGASSIVDPREFAVGEIATVLMKYPKLRTLVPAMGYGAAQTADLAATLNAADADLVLSATPIDLRRVMTLDKPVVRVRYELEQTEGRALAEVLAPIVARARQARQPATA